MKKSGKERENHQLEMDEDAKLVGRRIQSDLTLQILISATVMRQKHLRFDQGNYKLLEY
jgi:hypothetical protein